MSNLKLAAPKVSALALLSLCVGLQMQIQLLRQQQKPNQHHNYLDLGWETPCQYLPSQQS